MCSRPHLQRMKANFRKGSFQGLVKVFRKMYVGVSYHSNCRVPLARFWNTPTLQLPLSWLVRERKGAAYRLSGQPPAPLRHSPPSQPDELLTFKACILPVEVRSFFWLLNGMWYPGTADELLEKSMPLVRVVWYSIVALHNLSKRALQKD